MSFQGSLSDLPLSDIVQLVAVSGKTGLFSLTRASEHVSSTSRTDRSPTPASADVEGEDAIYALALWTGGHLPVPPRAWRAEAADHQPLQHETS